jgi:hypothetical protein
MTGSMQMYRLRTWLTLQLLAAAWNVLPKKHPAYRGIFDAGVAIMREWDHLRHEAQSSQAQSDGPTGPASEDPRPNGKEPACGKQTIAGSQDQ